MSRPFGVLAGELVRRTEVQEANMVLRLAIAENLTPLEQFSVKAFLAGLSDREAGQLAGVATISRGAIDCLRTLRIRGCVRPSQEYLASRMGCAVRTVERRVSELREAGLLDVERRQRRVAEYHLKNQEFLELFVGSKNNFADLRAMRPSGMWEVRTRAMRKLRDWLETEAGIWASTDLIAPGDSARDF